MKLWIPVLLSAASVGALWSVVAEAPTSAATAPSTDGVIAEMVAAAKDFLAVLDDGQKAKASFEFSDAERENWHFVPYDRKGLPLKEMRQDQQHLAYAMLNTAVSHEGFRKAATIMSLEKILADLENNPVRRDPSRYFISIFGRPEAKATWGWRFEGHHLAMNFTVVEGKHIAVTPTFMGANPGEVASGSRQGLQALGKEDALGFELMKSFSEDQRKVAIVQEKAPEEVISKEEKRAKPLEPSGLSAEKFTDAQKATLTKIILEYVGRFRPEISQKALAEWIGGGWAQVSFAWAGATEPGQGHYYRIQTPKFLIEFDNIQNEAKHPHAVWRDFGRDFGDDLLKEHYKAAHGAK